MTNTIARLEDIAKATGFSKNTVSLALRESPRIPQITRELIQTVARELNYRPNHIAKALTNRETKTIGLVLADITNPILTQTSQALEKALMARGYGTLFATSNNSLAEEVDAIEMFQARQVDGMLIYPTRGQRNYEHILRLRRANFPVVMLVPGQDAGIDMVSVDEKLGAYKAVRHLIDQGHTAIGTIDGNNPNGNREKFEGYFQALTEAGIAFRDEWQVDPVSHTPSAGYWAMDTLMNGARPTAVFVANDYMALGALRWCQRHDLDVPRDMALIGFDNLDISEFFATPLSSVNYEIELVTRMAVDRLMRLIGTVGTLPEPRVTLIEPELVLRDSTARR